MSTWTVTDPVITQGREYQHIYLTAVGTMNGTTAVTSDDIILPGAIIGGSVMATSNNGANLQNSTLTVRVNTYNGVVTYSPVYTYQLTLAGSPDYWVVRPLFENFLAADNFDTRQVVAPVTSNRVDGTSAWQLEIVSDTGGETNETVTVHIGMLAHRLEV